MCSSHWVAPIFLPCLVTFTFSMKQECLGSEVCPGNKVSQMAIRESLLRMSDPILGQIAQCSLHPWYLPTSCLSIAVN